MILNFNRTGGHWLYWILYLGCLAQWACLTFDRIFTMSNVPESETAWLQYLLFFACVSSLLSLQILNSHYKLLKMVGGRGGAEKGEETQTCSETVRDDRQRQRPAKETETETEADRQTEEEDNHDNNRECG